MSRRNSFLFASLVFLGGIGLMLVLRTRPVHAQCEGPDRPSCVTCHTVQAQLNGNDEWHDLHARAEICVKCHGGNGSAFEKERAHEHMIANPLSDTYTSCHQCHPDYQAGASRFAATLQITPASCATSTPAPADNRFTVPPPDDSHQGSAAGGLHPGQPYILVILGFGMLGLFCTGLAWLDRHRVKA